MKTVNFVPECCKGDDASFEGSITLRKPTFDERMDFLEKIDDDIVDDSGNVSKGKISGKLKMLRSLVKESQKYYVAIVLKHKESGEAINSFEDLAAESDAAPILIEVANYFIKGLKVGNA